MTMGVTTKETEKLSPRLIQFRRAPFFRLVRLGGLEAGVLANVCRDDSLIAYCKCLGGNGPLGNGKVGIDQNDP